MASQKTKNILYRTAVVSTFGIAYWVAKARAKRLSKKINTKLSSSEKIDFSIDAIIEALGSKQNIKDVSSTLSSVSIIVDDMNKVKASEFKKNGIQGVLKRAKKITLLFGDNAPAVKKVIDNMVGACDNVAKVSSSVAETKDKLVN